MFYEVDHDAACREFLGDSSALAKRLSKKFSQTMLVTYALKGGVPAVQVQVDATKKWFRIPLDELKDASDKMIRLEERIRNCLQNELWENPRDRMKRDPYHKLIVEPEKWPLLQKFKQTSGKIYFHG